MRHTTRAGANWRGPGPQLGRLDRAGAPRAAQVRAQADWLEVPRFLDDLGGSTSCESDEGQISVSARATSGQPVESSVAFEVAIVEKDHDIIHTALAFMVSSR